MTARVGPALGLARRRVDETHYGVGLVITLTLARLSTGTGCRNATISVGGNRNSRQNLYEEPGSPPLLATSIRRPEHLHFYG